MKQAITIALLVLVASACDANYEPPKAYGVGAGYGTNGRAFAGQQAPTPFIYVDAGEEGDGLSRQSGDVTTATDIQNDFSAGVLACIADDHEGNQAYGLYCQCLEDNGVNEGDQDCTCDHLVCVESPPDEALLNTFHAICVALGKTAGKCAGELAQ